jgi:hypothetical protein
MTEHDMFSGIGIIDGSLLEPDIADNNSGGWVTVTSKKSVKVSGSLHT